MTKKHTPDQEQDTAHVETLQEASNTSTGDSVPDDATVEREATPVEDGTDTQQDRAKPSERISEQYFDDDAEYLEDISNDAELFASQDMAIYKQDENTISLEVQNLRNESGKLRNKFALRNDPPVFHIKSSNGEYVEFALTQAVVKRLAKDFDAVDKAYYGIDTSFESPTLKEKFTHMREWIQDHPIVSGIIAVMIILFILAMVI